MTILQWVLVLVGGTVFVLSVVFLAGLARLSRNQPATEEIRLAVENGFLPPCPDTPNCVSTQAPEDDRAHRVEPISYQYDREEAYAGIVAWIRSAENGRIVEESEDVIRAVFTSKLFRFKDDVLIYLPRDERTVHLRSASRVGVGDMGVNRARYEDLKSRMVDR